MKKNQEIYHWITASRLILLKKNYNTWIQQINSLIETLIEEERVGGQLTLQEWAERRFTEIYAEPVSKLFTFQIPSPSVGIGISPV